MLTAFGAIGLLLQSIPMLFYQFDEKDQAGVEDNVDHRADHGGKHTGLGKALRGDKTVSYTHLDVYKRQTQGTAEAGRHGPAAGRKDGCPDILQGIHPNPHQL